MYMTLVTVKEVMSLKDAFDHYTLITTSLPRHYTEELNKKQREENAHHDAYLTIVSTFELALSDQEYGLSYQTIFNHIWTAIDRATDKAKEDGEEIKVIVYNEATKNVKKLARIYGARL